MICPDIFTEFGIHYGCKQKNFEKMFKEEKTFFALTIYYHLAFFHIYLALISLTNNSNATEKGNC